MSRNRLPCAAHFEPRALCSFDIAAIGRRAPLEEGRAAGSSS